MENDLHIEDEQFEKLLADKQHKELMGSIKQLISSIKEDTNSDKEVMKFIKQQGDAIASFTNKLNEVSKPNIAAPQVAVNVDLKSLNDSLKKVEQCCDTTNLLLQKLIDIRMADIEMSVERNTYSDLISKVTARTIVNKPSKYNA